jgi:hypothetical protein
MKDDSEAAENFEPRQIEREPNSDEPGQRFVIIDVVRELDRIKHLEHAGVNEDPSNDQV